MPRVLKETVLQAGGAIRPALGSPARRTVNAVAAVLLLLFAFVASAATVRSKADLRLWETAQDRSLAWPWAAGADTAAIAFSNRVTRSVASVAVSRGEGESRGCCELPAEWSAGDAIVDISLVQTRGGAEVARESATVAFVPGAGGGPVTVRAAGTRDWQKVREARVFADDPSWHGEVGEFNWGVAWPNVCGLGVLIR